MRPLDERQNHYEVLEIGRDASADEVERSYRIACATWEGDSLALYSLYDSREAQVIRERIDRAYQVLSDAESRRLYDAEAATAVDPPASPRPSPPLVASPPRSDSGSALQPELPAIDSFEDLEAEEGDDFGGARLRRARLRRGIEIDEIARVTKISSANLRFLEEESFDDLPAAVYVRGFVTAYARAIGLDPARVATSYLAHLEEVRGGQRRGRILGRK